MTDYEQITSFNNLYKGLKASCRGVRWKSSTIIYETNALKNTYLLRHDLLDGTYSLQPYQKFIIYEPKKREVVATRIRDRQFQHSMVDNAVYDQVTANFIDKNCACQKGKGVDYCLKQAKSMLRDYYADHGYEGYVAKCDIKSYFASIPHSTVKDIINQRIPDPDIRRELFRVVDSYEGDKGLGLGSQINQILALALLDDLDHYITVVLGIRHYIRYMDDIIIVHYNKLVLKKCISDIRSILAENGLKLNDRKTNIFPLSQGFILLKWKFYLKQSGKVILKMDRKKVIRQKKKIEKLWNLEKYGKVKHGTCDASMRSFMANAKRGDTFSERTEVAKFYRKLTGRRFIDYAGKRRDAPRQT